MPFDSPTGGTLDFLESSITDLGPEFRLTGSGLGSITLDNSSAPLRLSSESGHVYRYFLQGNFAENAAGQIDGEIQLTFLENSWSYVDSSLVIPDQVSRTPETGNYQPGDFGGTVFEIDYSQITMPGVVTASGANTPRAETYTVAGNSTAPGDRYLLTDLSGSPISEFIASAAGESIRDGLADALSHIDYKLFKPTTAYQLIVVKLDGTDINVELTKGANSVPTSLVVGDQAVRVLDPPDADPPAAGWTLDYALDSGSDAWVSSYDSTVADLEGRLDALVALAPAGFTAFRVGSGNASEIYLVSDTNDAFDSRITGDFTLDGSSLTDSNVEFLDQESALPGIQFVATTGVTATLDVTRDTVFVEDGSILRVPVSYVIADGATAPGASFSITASFDPNSVGFSGTTPDGTLAGDTLALVDEASAVGDNIGISNDRTYIDILFGASAGSSLDLDSVLDAPNEQNGDEFTLSGLGVGTAVLLDTDNPLHLGNNVFRYFIGGDFAVGEVDLNFTADTWSDDSGETNHAFVRSYTVQGTSADLIVIRTQDVDSGDGPVPTEVPTSLNGSEIGLAEINEAGFIDVTFRPTNGNTLEHTSVNGDELTLTHFQGNVISFTGTPVRLSGTDTFRFTLGENLAIGVYTVTIEANSYSDSAGYSNLEEIETFTVNVARAALTNPPSGSTENRETLNSRGYIDVTFDDIVTPILLENGDSIGFNLASPDADSILDAGPEFVLFDAQRNQIVVEDIPVALGNNIFRYFIQSGADADTFKLQYLPTSWDDVNGNSVSAEQTSGFIAKERIYTDADDAIDIQFNGIRVSDTDFQTFNIDEATIIDDTDDEITVMVMNAEGMMVQAELSPEPVALGNGRFRYTLVNGESLEGAVVTFNANTWSTIAPNPMVVTQTMIDKAPVMVGAVASAAVAGPYFDITYDPIDGTEVDASTILEDGDDEFILSGAQSQNLIFQDVYDVGNNTFRYVYQGQLDTGIMEVQFIEGAWADTAGNLGQAGTSAIKILTESESFFIEISGGIVLKSGGFSDEPIIELSGEIIMEFDTERSVFSLDFNAQLALYKLGSVGAVAGRFVIDNSHTVSENVQIWGVAALRTNFSFLEQYGLFLNAEGTLQLNLTSQEKTETLTFKGLDGGADRTETFVLSPNLFAIELVGFARVRPLGSTSDVLSLEGGFHLSFSPSRFELFVTASLSFGAGEASVNFGQATGLLVIQTGERDGENLGLAGSFRVSAGADIGLPDIGNLFKASGSVTVVINTTEQDVIFQLPDSFLAIIDGDELPGFAAGGTIDSNGDHAVNEEDKASFTIYKSAPGIDGQPRIGVEPEVYATAIIQAELIIGGFIELVGFLQITAATDGVASLSVTGAVSSTRPLLGTMTGTLNFDVFLGARTGVVGRVVLSLSNTDIPSVELSGIMILEINTFSDDQEVTNFKTHTRDVIRNDENEPPLTVFNGFARADDA